MSFRFLTSMDGAPEISIVPKTVDVLEEEIGRYHYLIAFWTNQIRDDRENLVKLSKRIPEAEAAIESLQLDLDAAEAELKILKP